MKEKTGEVLCVVVGNVVRVDFEATRFARSHEHVTYAAGSKALQTALWRFMDGEFGNDPRAALAEVFGFDDYEVDGEIVQMSFAQAARALETAHLTYQENLFGNDPWAALEAALAMDGGEH